ncbi:hypothetical protein KA977_08250, partial [Candidatus Dependentiae bacterium]|nr:hypothetical protein [Candidatus Dependentiae bacterium]
MYFEVEAYDLAGTLTDTTLYANDELEDTVELLITSRIGLNGLGGTVPITLIETGKNTNIYRNWLENPYIVNEQALQTIELESSRGDTIIISANVEDTAFRSPIELIVSEYRQPTQIRSIRFFTDNSYTSELAGLNLLMEDNIYIQLVGRNSASILVDTFMVVLHRNLNGANSDSIQIMLTETEVGSEIYRVSGSEPVPKIYYFSADNSNFLYAGQGDTISVTPYKSVYPYFDTYPIDVTRMGAPISPISFFNLNVFINSGYSQAVSDLGVIADDANLYIEARGDVGNNAVRDTTPFVIENLRSGDRIIITLYELGGNSGVYRGSMKLKPSTNDTLDELGVFLGDTISVYCADNISDTNKPVSSYPKVMRVVSNHSPLRLNNVYFKDELFEDNLSQTTGKISRSQALNIEVNGEDANPQLAEYMDIYIYSVDYNQPINIVKDTGQFQVNNSRGYLKLRINETEKNSGRYRGTAYIRDYNDTNQRFIKAYKGDTLIVLAYLYNNGTEFDTTSFKSDTIQIATNQILNYITFLNYRADDYNTNWGDYATYGDNLYIMLFGDIGSPVLADEVNVILYKVLAGDTIVSDSLVLTLKETGMTTGEFRGRVNLGQSPTDVKRPDAVPKIMSINNGDTLFIIWKDNDQTFVNAPLGAPKSYSEIDSVLITAGLQPITPPANEIISLRITESDYVSAVDQNLTEILPDDKIYIEVIANDQNSFTVDTTRVIMKNLNNNEQIYVDLIETGRGSGEFQGFITLTMLSTNQSGNLLRAGYNNIIKAYSAVAPDSHNWQIHTTYNKRPVIVSSMKFMNSLYNEFLTDKTLANQIVYIEANGLDANPLIADTFIVYVTSNKDTAGIPLTLRETSLNSGRYRNWVKINNFTDAGLQYINAFAKGDTIVVSEYAGYRTGAPNPLNFSGLPGRRGWIWGDVFGTKWQFIADEYTISDTETNMYDIIFIENETIQPADIIAVRVKSNYTYLTDRTEPVGLNDVLYIELTATDINSLSPDMSEVILVSGNISDWTQEINNRIEVSVYETEKSSSKFRGEVNIKTRTNDTLDELGVNFGDTIYVISKTDTSILTTLVVANPVLPATMNKLEFTEPGFQIPYNKQIQVQRGDYLNIRFMGNDISPYTEDQVAVLLTSSNGEKNDSGTGEFQLIVNLTETGKHTGVYVGRVLLSHTKNNIENWLKNNQNDFVYLEPYDTSYWGAAGIGKKYNEIISDSVQTATMRTPDYIYSITLKTDPYYSTTKLSPIKWGDESAGKYIYIEAQADKLTSSNLLSDTVKVRVQSTNDTYNLDLILWETEIHSGIFRGQMEVRDLRNVTVKRIDSLDVYPGDTVEIIAIEPSIDPQRNPVVYKTRAAIEIAPTRLKQIRVYRNSTFSGGNISEVSYEEPFNYFYIEAEAWDFEGSFYNDTIPYLNDEIVDTFLITLENRTDLSQPPYKVSVEMTETSNNSNIYRTMLNIPYLSSISSPDLNLLYGKRGDTILIYPNISASNCPVYYQNVMQPTTDNDYGTKTLTVAQYRSPQVKDITLFQDDKYIEPLSGKNLKMEDFLYPQIIGSLSNPILRDTITVYVKSSNLAGSTGNDTYIEITLRETAVGSEIYRVDSPEPQPRIWYWSQENNNLIVGNPGDTIEVSDTFVTSASSFRDFTYMAKPMSPVQLRSLNVFRDITYSNSILGKYVPREMVIYIEARSDDFGNNIINDTTAVTLNANYSNDTVTIVLTEIAPTAGIYRGYANLGLQSSSTSKTLGVDYGNSVYIKSDIVIGEKEISFYIVNKANPTEINSVKFMNSEFDELLKNYSGSKVLTNEKIYIELNGLDGNPDLVDNTSDNFVYVYTLSKSIFQAFPLNYFDSPAFYSENTIFRNNILGQVSVNLYETSKNSGKYRNWLQLSNVSDTYQQLLKHSEGNVILVRVISNYNNIAYWDTAQVAIEEEPSYLTFLDFKQDFNGSPDLLQNLSGNVTFGDTLYIQAFGGIGTTLLRDTTLVYLYKIPKGSIIPTDSVSVILYETEKTSGFYQGIAQLSSTNFQPTNKFAIPPLINIDAGDTLIARWHINQNLSDTVLVFNPEPKSPSVINSINFYRDNNYSDLILGKFVLNEQLFISIIEGDTSDLNYSSSQFIEDTVILQATNGNDTIHILCSETGKNTKIYRGVMKLDVSSNETLDLLESTYGSIITFTPYVNAGYNYFKNPSVRFVQREVLNYSEPNFINSIKFIKSDFSGPQGSGYSPILGEYVNFEVNGKDANPLLADNFSVVLEAFQPNGLPRSDSFLIQVSESGIHTGVYRGYFQIDRFTFPALNKIRVEEGDTIVVRETLSGKKAVAIMAKPSEPVNINDLLIEGLT